MASVALVVGAAPLKVVVCSVAGFKGVDGVADVSHFLGLGNNGVVRSARGRRGRWGVSGGIGYGASGFLFASLWAVSSVSAVGPSCPSASATALILLTEVIAP